MGALRGIKDKRTELAAKRLWTLLAFSSLVTGCLPGLDKERPALALHLDDDFAPVTPRGLQRH